ncbi:MAG: 1-acyl-sn-glycerol-3-phosphate acyltransferase [Treponema sp.]|nr:1-acyl-sn-glycerol-3-phosphate acyltransferase [Treponema sp.]
MIITIIAFIYIIILMIFLFPLAIIPMLLFFLGLKKPMAFVIYKYAQFWASSIIGIFRVKVSVIGQEIIPKKGGFCFVSNHCGYFDILLFLAYAGRPFGFIAKKELLFVPFLNFWIYVLGGLFIDRRSLRKGFNTIKKGARRIETGNGMIIFPEGTRSKGKGLLPFRSGSLKLATMAKAPIIPVAIEGSYDVFEKTRRLVRAPVRITFMEPIDTANLSREEQKTGLADRIFSAIKEQMTAGI